VYRKDVNERSPLRVFERSTHGGLGRGNLGVVISRAGQQTAFSSTSPGRAPPRKVLRVAISPPSKRPQLLCRDLSGARPHDVALRSSRVRLSVEGTIHPLTSRDFTEALTPGAISPHACRFRPEHDHLDNFPFSRRERRCCRSDARRELNAGVSPSRTATRRARQFPRSGRPLRPVLGVAFLEPVGGSFAFVSSRTPSGRGGPHRSSTEDLLLRRLPPG
jgi:hypothetical protein